MFRYTTLEIDWYSFHFKGLFMDNMAAAEFAGWFRPILAGCIGLVGIGTGSGLHLKRGNRSQEENFAFKRSILCLVLSGFDIASTLWLPIWYNILLIIPYIVVLVFLMRRFNEMQEASNNRCSLTSAVLLATDEHGPDEPPRIRKSNEQRA